MTRADGAIATAALSALDGEHAGGLRVDGLSAEELAARFGTPLYVFGATALRAAYQQLRSSLGERVEILFALKANPNAAVASVLREQGAGCELASGGELLVALRAGFDPAQLQFAGPGKSTAELSLALQRSVFTVNVESQAEYGLIRGLAAALGVRPGIALRINLPEALPGSPLRMSGGSRKFGIDSEHAAELAQQILADDVCELRGLHVYTGTQQSDAEAWLQGARALLACANAIEQECSTCLRTLNFGGGFGVPLFAGDRALDLARVGRGLGELIAVDDRPERRYFVEPGRALVAYAGVYLTRVLYVKTSRGVQHVIVDGGMHQHAGAAGAGSVIRRAYPWVACRDVAAQAQARVTLGGVLCTPADEFAANLELPSLRPGDLLGALGSGAYGLTYSNAMFLGHPAPAEVLVDCGRAWLVRERGSFEDALRGQRLGAGGGA